MFDRKPLPSCQKRSLLKGVPSDEQQKPREGERKRKEHTGREKVKLQGWSCQGKKRGEKRLSDSTIRDSV